jgi:hypothetical protein
MNKLNEELKVIAAFPGGEYGALAVGGSTGPWLNGAATPGTTGVMGASGPLGGPIDTQGFDRALVIVGTKGHTGTNQASTITAHVGSQPWFSDSGTTAAGAFSITTNATASPLQVGEIKTASRFRYLWIQSAIAGLGRSQFDVTVVLGQADKLPTSGNNVVTAADV